MALRVRFLVSDKGITVPYDPVYNDVQSNNGFVDLRGKPEMAAQIVEASQSSALSNLLVSLSNSGTKFFSLGCDLGQHDEVDAPSEARSVAGGYVQIISAAYNIATPEQYRVFSYEISRIIRKKSRRKMWAIDFVLDGVRFRWSEDHAINPSVSIWFYAAGSNMSSAISSRENLIDELCYAITYSSFNKIFCG